MNIRTTLDKPMMSCGHQYRGRDIPATAAGIAFAAELAEGRLLRCIVGTEIECPHCGRAMSVRLEIGADRIVGTELPKATQEPLWGQQLGAFND